MLRVPDTAQSWAVGSFCSLVIFHMAFRLYVKAHKARAKPRGEVHQPRLFGRMILWYFLFFFLALTEWASGIWAFHWELAVIGAGLYLLSMGMQWSALENLGKAYSPDIEVREEQPLVQTGLYRFVRHPLLAAMLLEVFGILIFFGAYGSLLLWGIIFVPLIRTRMREEEKALLQHFGSRYQRYREQVGGLCPRLMIATARDV